MKYVAFPLALLLFAVPAAPAAAADARVRTVLFKPETVVRFVGKPGYQSAIRFGPDERIENVAVGDSVSWQVTPNKRGDHLFVKPLAAGARSNLMVVTDKRTYLFDLETGRGAQPVYALSFEYPDYPAPGSIPPPPEPAPASTSLAQKPPPSAPLPQLHFGWTARGAKALRPARVFDDGQSTYLSWPEKVPLPAVLVPAPDGTESPSNYRMEKGYIIVEGVAPQLILRRGKHSATVTATPRSGKPVRTANTETRDGSR
jgi:type IV secretion system protein VirB9